MLDQGEQLLLSEVDPDSGLRDELGRPSLRSWDGKGGRAGECL